MGLTGFSQVFGSSLTLFVSQSHDFGAGFVEKLAHIALVQLADGSRVHLEKIQMKRYYSKLVFGEFFSRGNETRSLKVKTIDCFKCLLL